MCARITDDNHATRQPNTQTHDQTRVDEKMRECRSNRKGRASVEVIVILEVIRNCLGLSQYELAIKLKSSIGLYDGSIRRLLRQHEVFLQVLEGDGRTANLIYPKDQKPSNLLEVPAQLLKTGNPLWNRSAFIYALGISTMGISGEEMPEWKKYHVFSKKFP
jgi:hypothetical protein